MELIIKYKKLFAFLFWTWVGLIIIFTVIPHSPKMEIAVDKEKLRLDYFFHFIVYFGLSILFLFWRADKFLKVKSNQLLYFLIGGLLLAVFSEYAQSLIPNRTFNPYDMYSNVFGIIIGVLAPKIFIR